MFTDFTGLASHFRRKRQEEEAAELAARREETRRRQEEKVVGGVYRPEPVNKEAAMLIAKAPWFFHPPQNKEETNTKENNEKAVNDERDNSTVQRIQKTSIPVRGSFQGSAHSAAKQLGSGTTENKRRRIQGAVRLHEAWRVQKNHKNNQDGSMTMSNMMEKPLNDNSPLLKGMQLKAIVRGEEVLYSAENIAAEMALAIQRNAPKEMSDLARIAVDSRNVLQEASEGLGKLIAEFDRVTKSTAQDIRMTRMTMVSECSNMVNALKDVRQFFLGPDYERETKRLAEFVELCERLKALKDSGFLDTVADTMIRLAAYEKA